MPMREFLDARRVLLEQRENYAQAVREFRWPVLKEFNWALDWFDNYLAHGSRANNLALQIIGSDPCTRTFRELSEESSRIACALRAAGVYKGDRVLVMLGNRVELWQVMLACMKLGAVIIPASMLLTVDDLRERVTLGDVSHVIVEHTCVEKWRDVPVRGNRICVGETVPGWVKYSDLLNSDVPFVTSAITQSDDPALLYFTSGTTARPKLVVHSHSSYAIGSLSTMYWLGLRPGDVHHNVSSPGWAKHAWSCLFAPWNAEATVFIANLGRFEALPFLKAISANGVTSLCAPPTVWRMLVQQDLKPYKGKLNNLCGAGEPLNPEVICAVEKAWDLVIRDGYGQTETTAQIGNSPGQKIKVGSVGRPLPGYDIVLLDEAGLETDEGEICLRLRNPPAGLMLGYQNPQGQVDRLTGEYFRTGDIAARDEYGYLTYIGRADDVFKSSDYRISPFELESALLEHPDIAEAAVVPTPDPIRLNIPKAFILLAAGAEPSEATALSVFEHIRNKLAPYKRIRRLEFCDLPKTISGKIRRVQLRRQELDRFNTNERCAAEFREEEFPQLQQSSSRFTS